MRHPHQTSRRVLGFGCHAPHSTPSPRPLHPLPLFSALPHPLPPLSRSYHLLPLPPALPFQAEDVTLGVLDAALETISHIVLDSPINQEYIRTNGGLLPIVLALQYCYTRLGERSASAPNRHRAALGGATTTIDRTARPATAPTASRGRDHHHGYGTLSERHWGGDGDSWPEAGEHVADALKVTETACWALGNVVFRHRENQREALQAGGLASCLRLLETPEPDAQVAALNLLVNLTDTNLEAQRILSAPASSEVLLSLLASSTDDGVLRGLCLLLSHAVWNHRPNQEVYGSHSTLRQLLSFLAPPDRRASPDRRALAPAGASSEGLVLYALMALVNLTYGNAEVQRAVRELGGVPVVQQQLTSPMYEVRRSASFCLGNMVKDNSQNAAALVASGGVELLLLCLNDEDEDELSKTAYSTICQLGEAGLCRLLSLVTQAAAGLREPAAGRTGRQSEAGGYGGAPRAVRVQDEMLEEDFDDMDLEDGDGIDEAVSVTVARKPPPPPLGREAGGSAAVSPVERLELCLPVVNGMVYTLAEMRQVLADRGGLDTILGLLLTTPPHVQARTRRVCNAGKRPSVPRALPLLEKMRAPHEVAAPLP